MKKHIIVVLLLCVMGLGVMALIGCKEEKKSANPGALLLMGSPKYFPEIPQGVAR
jgi:hypothetical protein